MNQFQEIIQNLMPSPHRRTPSGWISFNSVCCHRRGHRTDTRERGGIMFTDEGWNYHCFNCEFKAGWTLGHQLTKNTRSLLSWLGLSELEIGKINLFTLKTREQINDTQIRLHDFELETKSLPDGSINIQQYLIDNDPDPELVKVIEYIYQRGQNIDWYPWHWCDQPGYRDRLLIPFYDRGRIVGWTGRKITDGKPKYLTDSQPGYLFNIDRQTADRRAVILVEGQLDAIAVDGVAAMTKDINPTQIARLQRLNRPVIVVPDRDRAGASLIDHAVKNNWSVSMPPWDPTVKDTADAVKLYGRCYTLYTIFHYQESNPIKLQILSRQLKNK
jgi:hypothetical protein